MLLAPPKINPASLFTLALLAFPAIGIAADAQAAPARPSVSAGSGALNGSSVAFSVTNKSAYKVKGQVALSAGKVAAGKRAYSAKAKSRAKVAVPLSPAAKAALARKGSLKLTVKTSAKGGGRTVVRTSSVTIRKAAGRAPAAQPVTQLGPSSTGAAARPAPAQGGAPAQGNPGGGNPGGGNPDPEPQPAPVEWRGGDIIGGKYDDFTFSTDAGKLTLTSVPSFNVKCASAGMSQAEATTAESFTEAGPVAVGDQGVAKTKLATLNNSLMGGKAGSVTYTISTTAQDAEHITGEMKIYAYRWESSGTPGKPGYWYRSVTCSGSLPFLAIKK